METFATLDDYRRVAPDYFDAQKERVESLLALTSTAISGICDTQQVSPDVLKLVCVQATMRAMQTGGEVPMGVTQTSWAATPLSGSMSFSNPTGDIYFTALEKQLLGVNAPSVSYVNPKYGDEK